jgi:hypothetical protein
MRRRSSSSSSSCWCCGALIFVVDHSSGDRKCYESLIQDKLSRCQECQEKLSECSYGDRKCYVHMADCPECQEKLSECSYNYPSLRPRMPRETVRM